MTQHTTREELEAKIEKRQDIQDQLEERAREIDRRIQELKSLRREVKTQMLEVSPAGLRGTLSQMDEENADSYTVTEDGFLEFHDDSEGDS